VGGIRVVLMAHISHKVIADPKTRYGDGRSATRHLIVQRITGALNILFTAYLVWLVVNLAGADRAAMVAAIQNPWAWAPLVLLLLNVPVHMRIGMREIIEDYVHDPRLNRFSLMLNTSFALLISVIGIGSVLKIVFWG
jgi:succinate dehydrogenase / fumarate reductase membrane anchor subunit